MVTKFVKHSHFYFFDFTCYVYNQITIADIFVLGVSLRDVVSKTTLIINALSDCTVPLLGLQFLKAALRVDNTTGKSGLVVHLYDTDPILERNHYDVLRIVLH